MPDILIIDCAGPEMLVARVVDGKAHAIRSDSLRGQAEQLNAAIETLSADRPLSALDKILVNRGPGSFTGIRVALSTAYGLARGLERPDMLHPVSAFAVHRLGRGKPQATVVLESRRPEKYVIAGNAAFVSAVDALELSGDGATDLLTDIAALSDRAEFSRLTPEHYVEALKGHKPEPLEALYVRPPDVGPQAPKR